MSINQWKVLVVEDEFDSAQMMSLILKHYGIEVEVAHNGKECLQALEGGLPTAIVLDLMMPEMDGWQTYQHLREVTDVPVLVVSAIHNKDEVVRALRMGMDDYITKPFVNAEVVARVEAVLRRSRPARELDRMVFPNPGLVINFSTQEVIIQNKRIQLTGKEFAILSILARKAPEVVQYRQIAETVWGKDNPQVRNRIKYLVYLLRQKLEAVTGNAELIQNIDRLGYKLNAKA